MFSNPDIEAVYTKFNPNLMDSTEKYTTTNHYVSALIHQAVKQGINANRLLHNAGIDPAVLAQPEGRVRTENLAMLVQLMWNAMQDENLRLSRFPCKPGAFFMMGKLTIHQANLGKALRLGFRFYDLLLDDYKLTLQEEGNNAIIRLVQHNQELDPDHLLTELILLAWHRYSSWLIGENILLVEAGFNYGPPEHVDEYKYLFPATHSFDQDGIYLTFHRNYLKRVLVQNEASLKVFMSHCPVELFLRHRADETLTRQIRLLLDKKVESGFPDMEVVANTLHMTTQTLRRRLQAEGTSYQRIKDWVRRDAAIFHLTQQDIPVSDVAQRVGFSDPGVFVRAFRSWTGVTPGEYRNSIKRTDHCD